MGINVAKAGAILLAAGVSAAPFVSAGQYILQNPTSAADHGAVTGAGAVTAYETISGVNVVSVTAAAGVNTTLNLKAFTARQILEGQITLGVYIQDMSTVGSITVYVGDSAAFTGNVFNVSIPNSSAFPTSGWYNIVIDPASVGSWSTLTETSQRKWVTAVGSPSFASTNFTNVKILISTASGVACKVSFAECVINKRNSKGQICFVMDDGGATQFTRAKANLEANGLRASMGIIADLVGTANYMTLTNLQTMRDAGHECIVHGAVTLTTLADMTAVTAEIKKNQDFLINNGLNVNNSAMMYLYPQNVLRGGILGAGGEALRSALIGLGFLGARTTSVTGVLCDKFMGKGGVWCIPEIGHRAYISPTYTEADETANVDRVILRMQQAVALGRGFVITNHNIVADTPGTAPTSTIDMQQSNHLRMCQAAKALIDSGQAENVLFSQMVTKCISATV